MANPTKQNGRQAQPCTMVIFGGAGDLTRRLLIPALYNLAREKRLPKQFKLVGGQAIEADQSQGDHET